MYSVEAHVARAMANNQRKTHEQTSSAQNTAAKVSSVSVTDGATTTTIKPTHSYSAGQVGSAETTAKTEKVSKSFLEKVGEFFGAILGAIADFFMNIGENQVAMYTNISGFAASYANATGPLG